MTEGAAAGGLAIAGYLRFSWFGSSDTGPQQGSDDEAMARLWDPARLAERMHLFETLAAPSIRWQTDPDFELVVITSPGLPAQAMARLARIVAAVPQMRLLVTPARDIGAVTKPLVRAALAGDPARRLAAFRLDDDDALAVDFVARLRAAAAGLPVGTCIGFPSGLYGFSTPKRAGFGPHFKEWHAYGLARVLGGEVTRDPLRVQHRAVPQRYPNFSEPGFCSYLCTVHSSNNTGAGTIPRYLRNHPELAEAPYAEAGAAALARAFPWLTPAALLEILGGLPAAVARGIDPEAPLAATLTCPPRSPAGPDAA